MRELLVRAIFYQAIGARPASELTSIICRRASGNPTGRVRSGTLGGSPWERLSEHMGVRNGFGPKGFGESWIAEIWVWAEIRTFAQLPRVSGSRSSHRSGMLS